MNVVIKAYKDSQGNDARIRTFKDFPGYEIIITDSRGCIAKYGIYATEQNARRAIRRAMTKPIEEV